MKNIVDLINKAYAEDEVKNLFLNRIKKGQIYRDNNQVNHFCVFFCVFDPNIRKIFIGKHLKAGIWLVNGGHIEVGETFRKTLFREAYEELGINLKSSQICNKNLLTIPNIVSLDKDRKCKIHYDYWFFLKINSQKVIFDEQKLKTEYSENVWVTYKEALKLATHPTTIKGLKFLTSEL